MLGDEVARGLSRDAAATRGKRVWAWLTPLYFPKSFLVYGFTAEFHRG